MITLCIFLPPLGWFVMYKYSPFDKRTNFVLAAACFAFFVYANMTAGNIALFGGEKSFELRTTPEVFRDKFNAAARKLAPNLNLTIEDPLTVDNESFSHEFAPKLKLVGTVGNDGLIDELKIFAAPENQDESFQTLNVLGLLIATLNPELDAEDRGEVLRDLRMLKEVSTEGSYDWTTARGVDTHSLHAAKRNCPLSAATK